MAPGTVLNETGCAAIWAFACGFKSRLPARPIARPTATDIPTVTALLIAILRAEMALARLALACCCEYRVDIGAAQSAVVDRQFVFQSSSRGHRVQAHSFFLAARRHV